MNFLHIESLSEDERKLLLLALKVLYHDIQKASQLGWPVSRREIEDMVVKLAGVKQLL